MKSRVFSSLAAARTAVLAMAVFAALPTAAPVSALAQAQAHAEQTDAPITATALPLHPGDALLLQVGRLRYRGGLELRSSNILFGGLSGLDIADDRKKMIAMSDNGRWFSAGLLYDKNGDLSGVEGGILKPIKRATGYNRPGNWRDAESIAPDGNGGYFVAFERQHRIWHYRTPPNDPFDSVPVPLKGPDDIEQQPNNGGIEALARLCDRRLLAISENAPSSDGTVKAWVFDGKQWKSLNYALTDNFSPTGATILPDCNLAVVERSFTLTQGVRSRVVFIPAKIIRPGATLRGEELAFIAPPLSVDNMEGIAARRGANGETLIYLVSDDNFSGFQRTLIMMFELMPPPEKSK